MKSFITFFAIVLTVQSVLAASGLFPKMPLATNVYVVNCKDDGEDAKLTETGRFPLFTINY